MPPIEAPDAFGVFSISGAGRLGLDALLDAWWRQLLSMKKAEVKLKVDDVLLP